MKGFFNTRFLVAAGLVVLGALSRLLPHEYNLTPMMSLALFAGAYISDKRLAFIIPLTAMLISDIFLGFHSSLPVVYLGFGIGVGIGLLLRKKITVTNVALSALSGSVVFFVLTNLWVWLFEGMYQLNLSGLITCFEMALPFFRSSLIGDAVFCVVMFGGFSLAERYVTALRPVKAN